MYTKIRFQIAVFTTYLKAFWCWKVKSPAHLENVVDSECNDRYICA